MTKGIKSLRGIFGEADDTNEIICSECVQEPFLIEHMIVPVSVLRACIGCGKTVNRAFISGAIASLCRTTLETYFEIDHGIYPGYELSLVDVLRRALYCNNVTALESVASLLEVEGSGDDESDQFFSLGQEYRRKSSPFDDEEHERWYVLGDWHTVANQLTHGRRFFNQSAQVLFHGIVREALSAEDHIVPGLRPVVKKVPEGSEYFRARVSRNFKERQSFCSFPTEHLGALPKEVAANNRMSAAGIPHLYLSADLRTCVAEVRPSIGDEVVVGKFTTTKNHIIFDLTAFSRQFNHKPISFFDPSHEERHLLRLLLSHLHVELGRPVKIHDTDYVMTQALAEYIRFECGEKFDGIAFESVQNSGGVNYMLFDSGTDEEQGWPDWKPKFNVQISSSNVSVVKISALSYSMTDLAP
ncbi:RES family NAD+ phosphorylase [Janthinobacterium sp. BJB301]|uniref:RES family NAD+ phosphorylase n=1 Tax=Janthinobacterium sp. BJB301 TaxID=1560195 RepID=UPI0015D47B45|nr:RES family NAD+ phosphorylase [Janthinobacterium sp. BJB301]